MQKKYVLLFVALLGLFFSCSKKAPDTPITTVPERLSITPTSSSVNIGNTINYQLKYYNNLGEEKPVPSGVVWSVANVSIATVNSQGTVTGVSVGQTTIKAEVNGISTTALVSVTTATVLERLEITASSNTVFVGATNSLTLTYFNNQGTQAPVPSGVIWSTSNAAIAMVNQQGVVTGVAAGTATIVATLNSVTANFIITVSNSLERLEITPGSASVNTGATANFSLLYYNTTGTQAPVPSGIIWSSNNTGIVTVNASGLVTGVAVGQTTIRASLNATIFSTATVTVTSNNLATITLNPASEIEINKNQTSTITAIGRDASGNVITGIVFNWASANTSLASVNSNGEVTGLGYGSTNITATASSIMSPPLMVQVVRSGNFNGAFGSTGSAKLKIVNGVLRLETSSNFSVSTGAPDLRIYLSNVTNSILGAVEVATLNQRSGSQSWAVPLVDPNGQPVTITSFAYVMVWCRQFGGNYGHVFLPL